MRTAEPLHRSHGARSPRDGPAQEHTFPFKPEVIIQPSRRVFLDDEGPACRRLLPPPSPLGSAVLVKSRLAVILGKLLGGHGHQAGLLLRRRLLGPAPSWSGSWQAWSPILRLQPWRGLCLSAAIMVSITLSPLPPLSLELSSVLTRLVRLAPGLAVDQVLECQRVIVLKASALKGAVLAGDQRLGDSSRSSSEGYHPSMSLNNGSASRISSA